MRVRGQGSERKRCFCFHPEPPTVTVGCPLVFRRGMAPPASFRSPMSEITFVTQVPGAARQRARKKSLDESLTEAMNALIAVLALIFLAPVMLGVALAVFLQDGGPVLF